MFPLSYIETILARGRGLHRETFVSALELSGDVLRGLGQTERDVRQALTMFRRLDEERLFDDYKVYSDTEKLQERARSSAVNLEQLCDEDAAAQLRNKAASNDRLNSPSRPPVVVPAPAVGAKKD